MKKAYVITVGMETRIIADEDDFENKDAFDDHLAEKAIDKISKNVWNYVCEDNIENIKEDKEYPYGTLEDTEE